MRAPQKLWNQKFQPSIFDRLRVIVLSRECATQANKQTNKHEEIKRKQENKK